MYVLGVDASLTSTGLAWLDTDEPAEWWTGRIREAAPVKGGTWLREQAARMDRIAYEVRDVALGHDGSGLPVDLVVLEGPSFSSRGAGARDVAGLWWSIARELLVRDIEVLVIEPATRAKYATGRGRGVGASKHDVLAQVRATYPLADVPQHDVADAVALAALGARVKGFPVEEIDRVWVEEVAAAVAAREAAKEL
ncbi:hypothetical protein L332_03360 [Agrococcus pavilionensis RW1]|uniref:Uncharacterized protein n=1 Tax=Agrococcus pavilionensis RW1 TaxID=1330458 RepID=U1L938_9MICO|nr:hypothetical protein [Agrococcus pavilionensis]ERG63493.1 hypothetical protein L332_03360 [Agrococcus pavilionensis RW1]